MSRIFAYVRVSTVGQTTENQLGEIRAAGFQVEPRRIVAETVSGSVAASERPGFAKLVDRLEEGDILVVTKLDRLGRNAMDVRKTVDRLDEGGIKVHCLALGGVDLTSPAGRMTMGVINAVAEFERDLLIERTQAGLIRAKAEGKTLGRPPRLTEVQRQAVIRKLEDGASISRLARDFDVSRLTITRVRDRTKDAPKPDGGAGRGAIDCSGEAPDADPA
ncbi:recombinase family protein [Jiella pacifica]|uniref:Recombinase family protein n=1 Tax=Jiella pacifica TaxID=2696469 RepID=A0A6N9T870_9HYPH|nr:recombinase family protein [Jiella pacifica]NDW07614.1 recombinase family protein [Jiella pacifica]